jgi:glycosyltransferase involved in cell wall biosynthesis
MNAADRRPIVLVSFDPYERIDERYCAADRWGAAAARHDLVQYLVQHGAVDELLLVRPAGNPPPPTEAMAYLAHQIGNRLTECRPEELQALNGRMRLVCVNSMEKMARVCRVRRLLGVPFPVLGLLHTLPGPASGGLYHWILAEMLECDAIIATSRAGQDALGTLFGGVRLSATGTPPDVRLIPLAVDERLFGGTPRAVARETLGLPSEGVVFLWVGRFSDTFKADLEPLVHAFSFVCRSADATLVCAGTDAEGYTDRMRAVAYHYGVADRVVFITNFPLTLKPIIYAAADVFVSIVDNVQETFGLSLLEAMAAGLPIVASDWSGYRDIVVHGETGFLIETRWMEGVAEAGAEITWTLNGAGDLASGVLARATVISREQLQRALGELLCDASLRQRLGANGRDRLQRIFTWPDVARRYRALIEEKTAECGAHASRGRLITVADVFKRYATAASPPEGCLRLVTLDGDLEGRVRQIAPDEEHQERAIRAIDVVRRLGSVSLRALERQDARCGADIAVWLVKKGICALDSAPSGRKRVREQP